MFCLRMNQCGLSGTDLRHSNQLILVWKNQSLIEVFDLDLTAGMNQTVCPDSNYTPRTSTTRLVKDSFAEKKGEKKCYFPV